LCLFFLFSNCTHSRCDLVFLKAIICAVYIYTLKEHFKKGYGLGDFNSPYLDAQVRIQNCIQESTVLVWDNLSSHEHFVKIGVEGRE
jgi:hypothetical protein